MAVSIKPMTKAELRPYVAEYASQFQGWSKRDLQGYYRISAPFAQLVWFENLRSGAYRPVMTVSILVLNGGATRHEFLDHPYREVLPRDHRSRFEGVCGAMKEKFRPAITTDFDTVEAMQLFVNQSTERILDISSLAALFAYRGDLIRAKEMIAKVLTIAKTKVNLWDWEHSLVHQTELLSSAISSETHEEFLNGVLQNELNLFTGGKP
jgi:hypothetical protein